jgi:hypothetical protein
MRQPPTPIFRQWTGENFLFNIHVNMVYMEVHGITSCMTVILTFKAVRTSNLMQQYKYCSSFSVTFFPDSAHYDNDGTFNSAYQNIQDVLSQKINYTRGVHTIISPAQLTLLYIQRGDMFWRSRCHPQAFHCLWTNNVPQCSRALWYIVGLKMASWTHVTSLFKYIIK